MHAGVVEGMELSANARNGHVDARNIEDAHLSGGDVSSVLNSNHHAPHLP